MEKITKRIVVGIFVLAFVLGAYAQNKSTGTLLTDKTFSGLKIRNIGPAFMSGRISDLAIHPTDYNTWYVAVGSGGVWKTTNAGVIFTPIFDEQSSYSIGCVTIDHHNPHVVWVGTGENIGGRHVAYGDGIYRSVDGGAHWENMGLKNSNHISKILIHPDDSDILWVAAQGPLWYSGGDRGLYKTINGGKTWNKVLGDDVWVGVTDIVIDPRDPDRLVAATWERHRNIGMYVGGGPGTGIHLSTNGGETWKKLTEGLPKSNMGKIGLAISAQKPDILYAAIELDRRTGGLYKSLDRGATWNKQSNAVSGATGPHYYQELYASPHQFDKLYLVDASMQVSEDGGKTFYRMNNTSKHGDDHAIAFRPDDPDYIMVGSDGGLYESFDQEKNWRYMENLPITQFYKLALDDADPFYNIYGGTQDNSSQGGPSRTDNRHGIQNSDWKIVLGGDGHQPATEPGNPDIVYAQSQQGYLSRIDMTTGETVFIQPQPDAGEPHERFNWDAPILVSPHSPTRLYTASYRVWRSDDRGDSWNPISGDLTRNQDRLALPLDGKTWSWDSPWDISAMTTYNTIANISESPKQEGLIYAGTDDGFIQVTEDGGENWQRIEVGSLPGVSATAYVNDIRADLHDANTVYVALDDHKFGDLNPYILKSMDRGRRWRSITGNLPDRTLVWRLVQDHEKPELLFAGTEFGIYFTIDGGEQWVKLTGDMPTISFRDLAIQRRENDLVGASFGRGFFVFDDYSVLRHVSESQLEAEATLFPTRKAFCYVPRGELGGSQKGSQGADHYVAPNPPFGAVFTYYLSEGLKTKAQVRQEQEKKAMAQDRAVKFPGWEAVETERRQDKPKIWLTVKDAHGEVVRRVEGSTKKGFHRIAWDLRYPSPTAIVESPRPDGRQPLGVMAAPGDYTVTLSKEVDGQITEISEPKSFTVERLRNGALDGATPEQVVAYWKELATLQRSVSAASQSLRTARERMDLLQLALTRTPEAPGDMDTKFHEIKQVLLTLDSKLNGNRSKRQVGEKNDPTLNQRLSTASGGVMSSTYGPTPMHKRSMQIAKEEFADFKVALEDIIQTQLPAFEKALIEAGAPWVKGQPIPE